MTTATIDGDAHSLDQALICLDAVAATFAACVANDGQMIANLSRLNVNDPGSADDPITLTQAHQERHAQLVEQAKQRAATIRRLIAKRQAEIESRPELLNSLRGTGSWLVPA